MCLSCPAIKPIGVRRHNEIAQTVAKFARQSGITTLLEPKSLSSTDEKRPDIQMFLNHQQILVDVTVRHSLAPSYLAQSASSKSASLLQQAERHKIRKYNQMAIDNDAVFRPFAVNTLGVIGSEAKEVIQTISKAAEDNYSGHSFAEAYQSLLSAVAVTIQRGNALMMMQYGNLLNQYCSRNLNRSLPIPSSSSVPLNNNSIFSPPNQSCSWAVRLERSGSIVSAIGNGVPLMVNIASG